MENWRHIPIGYHGRSSSIVVSGTDIRRPRGQVKGPKDEFPKFSASAKLDIEVEVGFFVGGKTNLGETITMSNVDN